MATTNTSNLSPLQDPGYRLVDARSFQDALINFNGLVSTYNIAAAGTTQATATQLNSVINEVDTVAAGTGVNLPNSGGKRNVPFQNCLIINNGANLLTVYPFQGSSDTINGGTSITIAAGGSAYFTSPQKGKWFWQGSPNVIPAGQTGTFTLNGATPVTVAAANVTANSQVLVTLKTVGGTVGTSAPNVRTITPGTGFTIAGVAADTSVYNYAIIG